MKSQFKELSENLLYEMSLPKGFNMGDVMSVDEFLEQEQEEGNEIALDIKEEPKTTTERAMMDYMMEELGGDATISDVDIDDLLQQRVAGVTGGVDIAKRPERMLHTKQIVDENGNILNPNLLKKKIMQRPAKLVDQNKKIKISGQKASQMYVDSTLPSYQGLFVDEDTGEFKIVKTCPSAGECTKFCYAAKGMYVANPHSALASSRIVNFLMNDPEGFKNQLISELNAWEKKATKKKKTLVMRWHDSGDFLSEKYLNLAFDVARATPNVLHYAYTKQVPMIKQFMEQKPDNFVFNFSFGGEHDEMIDPLVDKHARVVPLKLFNDLPKETVGGTWQFPEVSLNALKKRVGKEFKVNPKSVIAYDELLDLPVSTRKKYNVLVWKGHGDDAATRTDVLGTYLLAH